MPAPRSRPVRSRVIPWLLAALLAACGRGEDGPGPDAPPGDPAAALAWVRAAEADDDPRVLDGRLARYPASRPGFRQARETRVVWTWRLQRALAAGRVDAARPALARLEEDFGGTGRTPTGRRLDAEVLRHGFVLALLAAARDRIEGARPDPAEAARLLGEAARRASADEASPVAAARRWIGLVRLADAGLALAPHAGPRVVVLADDFALGEAILPSVLGRWQRTLGPQGLRVSVVPILQGRVRVGIRRVPAASPAAELASIRERLGPRRVPIEAPADATTRARLGLAAGECALLVADRRGTIVARLRGPILDPRALETLVQRATTR